MKKGKEKQGPSSKNLKKICFENKIIIGYVEPIYINNHKYLARIDTGATRNSISKEIVHDLKLGPPIDSVDVRNAHGISSRDIIWANVEFAGIKTKTKFNVSDRSKMKYPVLIGRNLLKRGFLIDCSNENRDN